MNKTGQEYKKKYPIIRPSIVKELAHGTAVSNLAYRVGRQMGLSGEECYELALAGFLHDIGKLELAKYVHGKENETLIIEEMRYVRRHSRLGADILAEKGYSQRIVDMVRFHHENCDGSGYPMNLSRDDIPLGSRILRVCDVFVALTGNRPYRKAFDVRTAVDLMIEESKNFDIQVFLAFMNVVNEGDLERVLDTDELERSLRELVNGGQVTIAEFLDEWASPEEDDPEKEDPEESDPEKENPQEDDPERENPEEDDPEKENPQGTVPEQAEPEKTDKDPTQIGQEREETI